MEFDFKEFTEKFDNSRKKICRDIYNENQESIKIKNEERAVENLDRIFKAVFSISSKKGFQAMSMRDLSKESGMSMGALYGYFKNKKDLLAIIQRQGRAMIKNVLDAFSIISEDPCKRLRSAIKAHIFLSELARPWFFFTFMEARNLSKAELEEVRELEAYTENILVEILLLGEEKKIFKKKNHYLTASIIKAMQQDWYLKRGKYSLRKITPDEFAESVIEFVESFCFESSA